MMDCPAKNDRKLLKDWDNRKFAEKMLNPYQESPLFGRLFLVFQVFLVVDWAMKWLEKKYRQSQTEFFACVVFLGISHM